MKPNLKSVNNKQEQIFNPIRVDINNKKKITIVYEVNNYHNRVWESIKLFDRPFVDANWDKCQIIYKDKKYKLMEYFDINNVDKNEDYLSIELEGIDNITDAYRMFKDCDSLIAIPDISNWDTSNVQCMASMFSSCKSLISLPDLSKWNTSKVINMDSMFSFCNSLISISDISKWDISNVKSISGMFMWCQSLLSLPDISKWDISNVTSMREMFDGCKSLISLPDLSKWNTYKK